jgi:hypothetical protein
MAYGPLAVCFRLQNEGDIDGAVVVDEFHTDGVFLWILDNIEALEWSDGQLR